MQIQFIETQKLNETTDLADFWKKNSERNARVRAYKTLLAYLNEANDKRLEVDRINLESFFQQLLSNRPSVYHYDPAQDARALENLKDVMQSIDEHSKKTSIFLANLKYRYGPDAIRALDKFARELSRFNPKVSINNDVARNIDTLKKHMGFVKDKFGKQFAKAWTGNMNYADALVISKYGEEHEIYIDAFYLAESIKWFTEIKSLVKQKSELVVKPKEIHPELRRTKNTIRKYIDAEIELYQANQELAKLRAELKKTNIK